MWVGQTTTNGIKLEKFVFDVFQFSNNFVVWECRRDEEFSPLKNADKIGASDTPTTARESLLKLHKKYIEDAGGQVKEDCSLEISPLLSYCGENLQLKGSKSFNEDTVILEWEVHTVHFFSLVELWNLSSTWPDLTCPCFYFITFLSIFLVN